MRALVTGAAGFIGSHVCERFLNMGLDVIAVDNLSRNGSSKNLAHLLAQKRVPKFIHADVRIAGDVMRVFEDHADLSVVVHEAAQVAVTTSVKSPQDDFQVNAAGTLNILEAARKYSPSSAFLYASTNKVYGSLPHVQVEEGDTRYEYRSVLGISESEPLDFHSPYGCSKGCADQYVRDYARIYGLKTVVFRQSCVYGTRQSGCEDQGWLAWFTLAASQGLPIRIFGDGKQVRDVLWVEDLVDLYCAAIEKIEVAAGEVYNAGGGPQCTISLLELIEMLERNLGCRIDRSFDPWRPGDQRIFVADCTKAANQLGWRPKTRPVEGIDRLLNWIYCERALLGADLGALHSRLYDPMAKTAVTNAHESSRVSNRTGLSLADVRGGR